MSLISTAQNALGATLGTAYDYLTPGKGQNRITQASYNYFARPPVYAPPKFSPKPSSASNKYLSGIDKTLSSQSADLASTRALIASLSNGYQPQVYAPNLDYAGITAKARKQAARAVNPYYTKVMGDFLAQQGALKKQQVAQSQTEQQNIEDQLKQTLEGNDISKARTGEDVAQNISQINTNADQFQTDSGQQFTADRLQQAKQISQSGLTGGLGAQQKEAVQTAQNTAEGRQTQQFQQQKFDQELTKARTFEDLARSGAIATKGAEKGKKQVQVDLANFLTNQKFETKKGKRNIKEERLQKLAQKQSDYGKLAVNRFIRSISDPAKRAAAQSAYGGIF
jgi:hypothetical protein